MGIQMLGNPPSKLYAYCKIVFVVMVTLVVTIQCLFPNDDSARTPQ